MQSDVLLSPVFWNAVLFHRHYVPKALIENTHVFMVLVMDREIFFAYLKKKLS